MKLGLVTDLHVAPVPHAPARWHNDYDFDGLRRRLRSALATLAEERVDAVAVLGDLTDAGDADSLSDVLGVLAEAGPPILVVPGNHDCEEAVDALSQAVGRAGPTVRALGPAPETIGGISIAGVTLSRPPAGRGFAAAALPELDTGASLVVSHFPVVSRRDRVKGAGFKYAGDLVGLEQLTDHATAASAPVIALSGHLHVRDAAVHGRLLQIVVPAMIEPPYECGVLEVDGEPLTVTYRGIAVQPTPAGLDVPLLSPAERRWVLGRDGWE